jgi:HAE1 family hydrophobic/amphiphilic exporter-1
MASRVSAIPAVETTVVTLASDLQKTRNYGEIYVKLKPISTPWTRFVAALSGDKTESRSVSQFDVMSVVRQEVLPQYAKLDLRVQVGLVNAFSSGANSEIMFWIGGPDFEKLDEYSKKLVAVVKAQPGVADVDTNLIVGKPELGVRIERQKAGDVGVRVQDIASTLNLLVGGQKVSDYYEHGEQYEVHVRADEKYRRDAEGFLQAEIPTSKGGSVRLADVVNVVEGSGPSEVNRIARRRQVLIQANMLPGYSSQKVIDAMQAEAEKLNMGEEYSHGLTGRSREQQKAGIGFMLAFALSIIFMYLILAAQFESWVHPVSILLALPLTVPFALLSIVVLNQSINIFSSLGILVLFGIVKKNGILQIDNMIQLRNQGVEREEAIRRANRDRLRPILMTTLAFVAGMLPLVVSSGVGSGTNRAIASVIIGGQTLALVLTLVGTPVAYSLFDDWSTKKPLRSLLGRRMGRRPA